MPWHKLINNIGFCFFRKRHKLHLSQAYLANDAFIDKTYLQKIEKGQANLSLRTLGKLARVLQMTAYQVLLISEKERPISITESAGNF